MIFGIGTDIVAVKRMDDLHERYGGKLAERLLAPEEWGDYAEATNKEHFLAKRFAAKEAFAKAVGTGMRAPVSFGTIVVVHNKEGKPGFVHAPELSAWLRAKGIVSTHLSLSDELEYVVAFVVAEHE
ncbi:MAG: holo-ACP synthase [Hydrogenophilales bacterium 28-61-23]|nr:MAG: holo-ACP synthase [Hydrogenophilales bacterium 28-61-23]